MIFLSDPPARSSKNKRVGKTVALTFDQAVVWSAMKICHEFFVDTDPST